MLPGRSPVALSGRALTWVALVASGCAWLDALREEPAAPVASATRYTVERGEGWAMQVPEGATVRVTPDTLSVDAPDGTWWYDVTTLPATEPFFAQIPATTWGERACNPLRLDLPAQPIDGVYTVSGTCGIDGKRYWLETVLVPKGDQVRVVGLIGRFGAVHYEDLWVHLFRTALTLRAGSEPEDRIDPESLRATIRGTSFDDPRGLIPVPGGGVFSAEVSRRLGERWTAWRDAAVPTRFTASDGG